MHQNEKPLRKPGGTADDTLLLGGGLALTVIGVIMYFWVQTFPDPDLSPFPWSTPPEPKVFISKWILIPMILIVWGGVWWWAAGFEKPRGPIAYIVAFLMLVGGFLFLLAHPPLFFILGQPSGQWWLLQNPGFCADTIANRLIDTIFLYLFPWMVGQGGNGMPYIGGLLLVKFISAAIF